MGSGDERERSNPDGEVAVDSSGPKLFRQLDRRGKLVRAIAIAFTVYHVAAMLVGGSVTAVRRVFKPLVGFYADGLRMTNSWGMFARPPNTSHVIIEAVMKDGSTRLLSSTRASDRGLYERIRDVRIRKLQGKLGTVGEHPQLASSMLAYHCRRAKVELGAELRGVRIVAHVHELRDDDGNVTRRASEDTLLQRGCDEAPRPAPNESRFIRRAKQRAAEKAGARGVEP